MKYENFWVLLMAFFFQDARGWFALTFTLSQDDKMKINIGAQSSQM